MKYTSVVKAVFIQRPNRFIAHVLINEKEEIVHVKNTGRCKEILKAGTTVFLEKSKNNSRKTQYSLISAYKENTLINIDSQVPNAVVFNALKEGQLKEFSDITHQKREVFFQNSRFDIYFESLKGNGYIEVKGVTLETDGIAKFPDAPTVRGTKHIYEMIKAVESGYQGYIFFLIQMKGIRFFTPNTEMDPEFANALKLAQQNGVNVIAYDALVTENEITLGERINVVI